MIVLREFILMSIRMLETGNYIKDSGIKRVETEMESVFNSGLTAPSTKECGIEIKLMEKVE